jgi:hypothetical protein
MGKMRNAYKTSVEKQHLRQLGIDRKILKCILYMKGMKVWNGLIWIRIGISGGQL